MRLVVALALVVVAACRPPGYGKGDDVDAAAHPDGRGPDAMTDGPGVASCDKAFRLDGHSLAQSVWLTGNFVAWASMPSAGAIALTQGVDGAWTGTHTFAAGPHEYKFIVDATQWILDPTNPDIVDDGMGNQNSRYTCTP